MKKGDIKPDNFILNDDKNSYKISDFGLSIDLSNKTEKSLMIEGFCGTPSYTSPELYEI